MNSKVYKWCAVPLCKNTSIATPNKLFVYVPNKKLIRDEWLKLARRDPAAVVTNSSIYFCEDHFDLPNDMENYMQYHLMGHVSQVRMKPGCVPKKFACQLERKTRPLDSIEQPHINGPLRKRKKMPHEKCEKQFKKSNKVTGHNDFEENASGSSVQQNPEEAQQVASKMNDKAIKRRKTKAVRSKAKQTKVRSINQMTSPLRPRLHSATSPLKINHCLSSNSSSSSVCRICFASNCKQYTMTENDFLSKAYESLTGLLIENDDNLPTNLCIKCAHQLVDYANFRSTSLRAHSTLLDIVKSHGCVTLELIQSFKRNHSLLRSKQNTSQSDHTYDVDNHVTAENCDVINHNAACTPHLSQDDSVDDINVENNPINGDNLNDVYVTNYITVCTSSLPEDDSVDDIKIENDSINGDNLGAVYATNYNTLCTSSLPKNDSVSDIKIENDPINGDNLSAVYVPNYNTVCTSSLPEDDAVDDIKIENDSINSDNLSAVHVTNYNTVCTSSVPENDSVNDIKVEYNPINCDNLSAVYVTNYNTECTSSLPEDDSVKDIKVENDSSSGDNLSTVYVPNYNTVCTSSLPENYSIVDIKIENDPINRDHLSALEVTNDNTVCASSLPELDNVDNIKVENNVMLN